MKINLNKVRKTYKFLHHILKVKHRKFGKQARLAIIKFHRASLASEQVKAYADGIRSKVNIIKKEKKKNTKNNLDKLILTIE